MQKTFSKSICIILSVFLMLSALPLTVHAANTWDPDNGVYDITTEDDLFAFNEAFWADGMYYEGIQINLLADITISEGRDWISAPSQASPYADFEGVFNGNGHTISNLNMVSSDNTTVSFLPLLYNATIKDLTLKDVTIENGYTWNSAFACISYGNDTITNCHLTGDCIIKLSDSVSGSGYCGGIVASKYNGSLLIENCSVGNAENSILISAPGAGGNRFAGGILAFARKGTETEITSTNNYANVSCDSYAGGIIGLINSQDSDYWLKAKITDCCNFGNISSNGNESNCGGILGRSTECAIFVIDRCVNHGNITVNCNIASTDSGGIVGMMSCGAVLNSYNTGKVEADSKVNILGGLVGHIRVNNGFQMPGTDFFDFYPENYINAIINCYNTGDVVGNDTNYIGGICGYVQDIYTLAGKSIIKNAYNFANMSGTKSIGSVSACLQDTKLVDVYGQSGSYAINGISIHQNNTEGIEGYVSEVGYFDTPDLTGTIYPAEVRATNTSGVEDFKETISSTPLTGNLLYLLNSKVDQYNEDLESSNDDYRYLTWKMSTLEYEDGAVDVSPHPMFGVYEFNIKFYPNFEEEEEPFRTYTAADLTDGKVLTFYDLPDHDGYIFKGWYLDKDNTDDDSPISFDTVYTQSTDIYAHWITVGEVDKDSDDDKFFTGGENKYGGFDLAGVQIRDEGMDLNRYEWKPRGMRFVTSLSMDVVEQINAIKPNNIEYGYVAATNKDWINYHKSVGSKLLYNSTNSNGINTSDTAENNKDYFGFAKNINCTSRAANPKGKVGSDHRNYSDYLLYTLVITYEDEGEEGYDKDVLARPYIKYTDANNLVRVAYSEYLGSSNVLGGCCTNYNYVSNM